MRQKQATLNQYNCLILVQCTKIRVGNCAKIRNCVELQICRNSVEPVCCTNCNNLSCTKITILVQLLQCTNLKRPAHICRNCVEPVCCTNCTNLRPYSCTKITILVKLV